MTTRPIRVAHLVPHPVQYFAPLYRELAARPEIDLSVFYYSDATSRAFHDPGFGRAIQWDVPLLGGYRHMFAPSARGAPAGGHLRFRPQWDIAVAVFRGRFDIVWIHGYTYLTAWLAFAAARATGARVLLREEANLLWARPRLRGLAKEVPLRILLSQAGALYIGEENRRFLKRYGAADERLFRARYSIDVRRLREREAELRPVRAELRRGFGVSGDEPVVLYAGKLSERKQPLLLIEAFSRMCASRPCTLLIVGDGALRDEAERLASVLGIRDKVIFHGFLNQTELPAAYVSADVFVLPSRAEPWGLVVNEAMTFGLPVVVTDQVGCATDLVRDGWNGYVVSHERVGELQQALDALVANAEQRIAFGERSRELAADYSIERCADEILAACLAFGRKRS